MNKIKDVVRDLRSIEASPEPYAERVRQGIARVDQFCSHAMQHYRVRHPTDSQLRTDSEVEQLIDELRQVLQSALPNQSEFFGAIESHLCTRPSGLR